MARSSPSKTPSVGAYIKRFLETESAAGILLFVAAGVALFVVNSPWGSGYESLFGTVTDIHIGPLTLPHDVHSWINEGLMTIFFFVVGLEIKREVVGGELKGLRRAMLPAIAALGGMVVPALIYVFLNSGTEGSAGWGIPMATDIAFAVGVLALLGPRVPTSMKVMLLAVAIADDIGAILVIALFYSGGIEWSWLLWAALLLGVFRILALIEVPGPPSFWMPIYLLLAGIVWLATLQSGVHATLAGVALGLVVPSKPRDVGSLPSSESLETALHPWSSFVVLPIFAVANAGVELSSEAISDAATSSVTIGIVLGLLVGKIVGISLASWVAVRVGAGQLPDGMTWPHVIALGAVAGVGFTVSLFVTALAFGSSDLVGEAKVGVLAGSLVAAIVGVVVTRLAVRGRPLAEDS